MKSGILTEAALAKLPCIYADRDCSIYLLADGVYDKPAVIKRPAGGGRCPAVGEAARERVSHHVRALASRRSPALRGIVD